MMGLSIHDMVVAHQMAKRRTAKRAGVRMLQDTGHWMFSGIEFRGWE